MALKNNTWKLNQWYDQDVAGNVSYSGAVGLFVMGDNGYGALNQNDTVHRSSPVQIPGTTWDADSISIDDSAFIGRKTDGTLWMSGSGGRGRLGNNDESTNYSSPIQIPGTNWSSVLDLNPIGSNSGAFRTGGELWMWGYNNGGQLGINQGPGGNPGSFSSPVQVPGTTWSTGCMGGGITAAIKTDNTLWAWGFNQSGTLAQNNRTNRSSPTQIPGTTWSTIQISSNSVGAIKTDGTMWVWGSVGYGVLGNDESNTLHSRSSPVQVPGAWESGSGKFSKHGTTSTAIKSDGTLWVWGTGWWGATGQNDRTHRSSPVQVPGTTWNKVSAGLDAIYATKTDGTLWSWGYNNKGQLGLNNRTNYSSPVQVPGGWTGSSGGYYAAALIANS